MIGLLGRLGAAATLGQHCPQMSQRPVTPTVYVFRYPLPNANVGSIRPGGIGSEEAIAEVNYVGIYRDGWKSPNGNRLFIMVIDQALDIQGDKSPR